ncbi:Protein N-acetyltransferase, RimJ/RimL family [Andreprevotia lacus DSM 23236]|uniref:Protein N-acetyltransferase, RimJ/RimL family n=1 Tax=Andreprevotia lacus DSM 23236 TaxID=1121001 RepID=A0A1W1XYF3_9NEIS|nr:GNAT family protein [Andreprevotia lacus]SMC28990.1 Protein N-acetyltransferase, RimJ/RimL family [Andreprevotia lacus DSM 23236]
MMTDVISLRAAEPLDALFWAQLRAQPCAQPYMPFATATPGQLSDRLRACAPHIDVHDDAELRRIVVVNGVPAGMLGAVDRSPQMASAELSYQICSQYQRRGIATQALRLFVQALFAAGYRRLYATVSVDNQPSRALLARLGFQVEGCLRQHYVIDGRAVDQMIYGLLCSESPLAKRAASQFKEV